MFFMGVSLTLLLLVAVGLLAVPVRVQVDAEMAIRSTVRWHVSWLFGRVAFASVPRVPPPAVATGSVESGPGKRRRRTRETRAGGRSATRALAALRTPGLLARAARLLRDLVRVVKWERAGVDVEFGLDDPSDTGTVYGALVPVLLFAGSRGYTVRCRPRFDEPCLQGSAGLVVHITPLRLVATFLAFACSAPALRAAYAIARS